MKLVLLAGVSEERGLAGALFHEAAHPALAVLGGEQAREPVALDGEAGLDVRLQTRVDRLLRRAQCDGGALGEPRGPGVRLDRKSVV